MQLIDGVRFQILADGGDAAADADVAAGGGLARAVERFADAAGDEWKIVPPFISSGGLSWRVRTKTGTR